MARELGAKSTVQKKMSQYIHYKSYAFRRGLFMNVATKERRLAKAKMLLNKLKAPSANGQLISSLTRITSLRIRRSTGTITCGCGSISPR
jgi:uncharacterized Rossmann fold enzyme